MEILTLPVGDLQANCYIVHDGNHAVLIDPGAEGNAIVDFLKNANLTPVSILLTHGHADHIGAIDILREQYNVDLWMHQDDVGWLTDKRYNLGFGLKKLYNAPERLVKDKDTLDFDSISFKVFSTPGHTRGGVCYYCEELSALFTGVTLFRGTIGRTDFLEGDHEALLDSVNERLREIPDDTIIYPGHGPTSTMEIERNHNPYFVRR